MEKQEKIKEYTSENFLGILLTVSILVYFLFYEVIEERGEWNIICAIIIVGVVYAGIRHFCQDRPIRLISISKSKTVTVKTLALDIVLIILPVLFLYNAFPIFTKRLYELIILKSLFSDVTNTANLVQGALEPLFCLMLVFFASVYLVMVIGKYVTIFKKFDNRYFILCVILTLLFLSIGGRAVEDLDSEGKINLKEKYSLLLLIVSLGVFSVIGAVSGIKSILEDNKSCDVKQLYGCIANTKNEDLMELHHRIGEKTAPGIKEKAKELKKIM